MLNRPNLINRIRASRTAKGISFLLVATLLTEIIAPTVSFAITEGPSQPEVQSFEPVNTTQMVDLFTGDFNYNIPLFNLPGPNGGYPVNLAYHAGSSPDEEASWVGLGWNINVGSLVRNMRGLPDEFASTVDDNGQRTGGDFVETKNDMRESWTVGANVGWNVELFGADLTAQNPQSLSLRYNNYKGLGASYSASNPLGSSPFSGTLTLDSDNGLGLAVNISNKPNLDNAYTSYSLGVSFDGKLSVDFAVHKSKRDTKNTTDRVGQHNRISSKVTTSFSEESGASTNYGSSMSFARSNFNPKVGMKFNQFDLSFQLSLQNVALGATTGRKYGIFYSQQDLNGEEKKGKKRPVLGYRSMGSVSSANDEYMTKDFVRMNDGQITKSTVVLPNSYYASDAYVSTGQGLSGFFRGRRNDVGHVNDPYVRNESWGASLSLEFKKPFTTTSTEVTDLDLLAFTIHTYVEAFNQTPAPSGTHLGVGGSLSFGWDRQGTWKSDITNDMNYDFNDPYQCGYEEIFYYQAHGEQTILKPNDYSHINNLDLALVSLSPKDEDALAGGKRRIEFSKNSHVRSKRDNNADSRMVRNTLIHDLKNNEVSALGEFKIKYYTFSSSLDLLNDSPTPFARDYRTYNTSNDVSIGNHIAGFKVLNEEGSYYVYGLPAYNTKETQNLFSVNSTSLGSGIDNSSTIGLPSLSGGEVDYKQAHTDKFISKTSKSPFPHSYLLTSVQGADYVDVLNDGPSDDDLGYWVKFDYVKTAENYKWRAPFTGANLARGSYYSAEDDKGSYQYGEKELWYLGRIETKTHLAVFKLCKREDAKGAESEYDPATIGDNASMLKVDEIRIYEKSNTSKPIQVVHFQYKTTGLLCPGTTNSAAANGGKLTLEKIWFTGFGSSRQRNIYNFDYSKIENGNDVANAAYDKNKVDPWGNYQDYSEDYNTHSNLPYVDQFNQGWNGLNSPESQATKAATKKRNDLNASMWCLRKITLPSGGEINIEYESDDYGYVQHKTANQMFKITKLGDFTEPNEIYNNGTEDFYDEGHSDDEQRRRIYFKLEYPLPVSQYNDATSQANKVYKDYVEPIIKDEAGNRNLYFKTKMRLTRTPDNYEYVSGYLPLENGINGNYGVATQSNIDGVPTQQVIDGTNYYVFGFVTVQATEKKNGDGKFDKYHPLALAGWTYMQVNAPKLISDPLSSTAYDNGVQIGDLLDMTVDFINILPTTLSNFGAIRPYCKTQNFARYIDLQRSCIRLASPDKIKFGGGHRVKQITITDNWTSDQGVAGADADSGRKTYGQVYDYTMEENGKIISSGVAQYEPQYGGDENALKYPIHYFGKTTSFTNNNLFTEAPVNEDLFPGASVGYRKVSVKSLNTQNKIASSGSQRGRTGGVTVHEFYTARDFPTLVEYSVLSEQNNTKDVFNLPIPIPLIGVIKRNYYHGTQAFKIELNDMHGRPKSVKSYQLSNSAIIGDPITESEYVYQKTERVYQGENISVLDNYVNVIKDDGTHDFSSNPADKRLMGVEAELFTDQRENKAFSNTGGLDFNIDVPIFGVVPSFWPSYSNSKSMFRTYVTNKVIHKTGILVKTKSRDLQTVNENEIIAYDEKSGIPMLSKVKNEFGDEFYNYSIPAYYEYNDGMGHAYENINYCCDHDISLNSSGKKNYLEFVASTDDIKHLVRGDELLVTKGSFMVKGYFLGWRYQGSQTMAMFYVMDGSGLANNDHCAFKVIRSGRRNQFGASIANYLTKGKLSGLLSGTVVLDNSTGYNVTTPNIGSKVLSATASLYRDDWNTSNLTQTNTLSINPYLTGNSGIWRPTKSYTYVGPRQTTASMGDNTTSNPNLKEDGVMSNVPMFSWELGNMENYVSNWEWVNEITRYSPDAYELENMNRLGIYSSALYGYNNSLSIGVAGNASYAEIGTYDFEYDFNAFDQFRDMLSQTNMNFLLSSTQSAGNISLMKEYNIISTTPIGAGSSQVEVKTDLLVSDYNEFTTPGNLIDVANLSVVLNSRRTSATSSSNASRYFKGKINTDGFYTVNGVNYKKFVLDLYVQDVTNLGKYLKDGEMYYGKLGIPISRPYKGSATGVSAAISTVKAHTGKRSLKINSASLFDQPKLHLVKNKKYIVSVWVSMTNTNVNTFKPVGSDLVEIGTMSGSTLSVITPNKITYSKVIEGWQKIDIEFTTTSSLRDVYGIRFTQSMYVDDIRFSPKTGGMTTSVYDQQHNWLTASLNVDNYASLFFYDEEGNLHVKKQETEKGIFTVTESRGHVPSH